MVLIGPRKFRGPRGKKFAKSEVRGMNFDKNLRNPRSAESVACEQALSDNEKKKEPGTDKILIFHPFRCICFISFVYENFWF